MLEMLNDERPWPMRYVSRMAELPHRDKSKFAEAGIIYAGQLMTLSEDRVKEILDCNHAGYLKEPFSRVMDLEIQDFTFGKYKKQQYDISLGSGFSARDSIMRAYKLPEMTISDQKMSEAVRSLFNPAAQGNDINAIVNFCGDDPTCVVEMRQAMEHALVREGFVIE